MTIDAPLQTGQQVTVHGKTWTIRSAGTAIYLYTNADALRRREHTRTISTRVLRRDGTLAVGPAAPPPCFLYVIRDCDLSETQRALKIGITNSIPATLRTYRRMVPNAQAIIVVDCRGAARPLERTLHGEFAEFRVDSSKVFNLRPHQVSRVLRRHGYTQNANGIYT